MEGKLIEFKQPNGKIIELKVIGSRYFARTATLDNYTVIYQASHNAYYYAKLDPEQRTLISSGKLVGVDPPTGLIKNIQIPDDTRKEIIEERRKKLDVDKSKKWEERVGKAQRRRELKRIQDSKERRGKLIEDEATPQAAEGTEGASGGEVLESASVQLATASGSVVGLTILVQFPDDPETTADDPTSFPVAQEKIVRFCNELGYSDDSNTGSVRDYFLDQSLDTLDYSMIVTPIVTLPEPRDFYNFSDYPTNSTLQDIGDAAKYIIEDAIDLLIDQDFDFDGLTLDGNDVLSTNILFAGATSGVWAEGLWPHQWVISSRPSVTINGVSRTIFSYQITNINDNSPVIGTFIHESGHLLLDLPDLYDYDGDSSGIGQHGLMASGNNSNGGLTPSPINIYFKDVLGWADVTDVTTAEFIDIDLPSTGNVGCRIYNPEDPQEFFIVENRGDGDPWAAGVPDKGVLIWHVDEAVSGNDDEEMTSALHYEVSLEQQDGLFDLENYRDSGDSQDAFDVDSDEFNDVNSPNANWWDGSDSGIVINFFSSPGSTMNVTFGVSNTIKITSPSSGKVVYSSDDYSIEWVGNIAGSVRIELYKDGGLLETLSSEEINDGSYTWVLSETLAEEDGYQIVITSLNDSSIMALSSVFSISSELFAADGVFPEGWIQVSSADKGWIVATDDASEGSYSIKNDDVENYETAAIEYTGYFAAGSITFDCKISSESYYDFFEFSIDGVQQDLDEGGALSTSSTGISGEHGWLSQSFEVLEGEHTITFEYVKDFS
ncbi:MAG: M6 family metalloprotease domain-containing protein, partial [Bacteroidota bacterium]